MFYEFLFRRRVALIFGALTIFTCLLMVVHRRHPSATEQVSETTSFLLSPFQRAVSGTSRSISGGWDWLSSLSRLRTENERLTAELSAANHENERLHEMELENARLQKLLNFKEKVYFRVALARVIGKEPTSWYRTVLLDKGTRGGIAKNMAVVTHAGIVGRVIDSTPRTSKVLLVTDPTSSVSAVVQRTRALGVVAGTGKRSLEM